MIREYGTKNGMIGLILFEGLIFEEWKRNAIICVELLNETLHFQGNIVIYKKNICSKEVNAWMKQ